MKHLYRRGGAAAALAGALLAAWGCTEEQTGLYIEGAIALEAPECLARAEGNTTLLLSGYLDVSLKRDYDAVLLVGSQMTPRGDKENLRTETMTVTLTGAEVRLLNGVGEQQMEFTVPASGTITPDGGEEAGFGVVSVTLIPPEHGVALFDTLDVGQTQTRVAQVRVFGETIGGLAVESAEMSYVIRVCKGCLVNFPPGALGLNGSCGVSMVTETIAGPCNFGQDAVVDCRLCAADNIFCANIAQDG